MRKYPGVVVALVKDLEDPRGEGRIQIEFPWLPQLREYPWAPLAVPFAGNGRGMYYMPEIGDEALVAFEQGDFDHPYIIGFLWNGVDSPPDDGITAAVRRIRTVSGHVIEFDDRTGSERIYIETKAGHKIEMKDTPPASINIQTTMGNQIQVSDSPPGVTISTPSGTLTVNCLQVNVSAPMTVFSGVVQTPTLIAQAVVGSSYTPAPGNTFGA